MSSVTVPRSDITAEEVSAVLRSKLGSHYQITPGMKSTGFTREVPADDNTILAKGSWFERANVRIVPGSGRTEIEVTPGASYFGLIRLIDQLLLARKVHRALENAPELAQAT
jgi:hypothetical protein